MSVTDGQDADQDTFNNAFASKTADNTLVGQQTLNKASGSGAQISDVQLAINTNITNIATNATDISNLDGRVTQNEGDITTINDNISALSSVAEDNTSDGTDVDASQAAIIIMTNATRTTINQIENGTDGLALVIINRTGGSITVSNESGGTASEQIITGTGVDLSLEDDASISLRYDGTNASKWQVIGGTGSGGGGGGGNLIGYADTNAPIEEIVLGLPVLTFEAGLGQKYYYNYVVPSSHVAGSQINMTFKFFANSISGTVLLQTVTTLIEPDDAVNTTTNQHTSTNSAITQDVTNELEAVTCDLTDASGEINSTVVAAGDMLRIEVTRGTDTATEDAHIIKGTEGIS